MNLREGEKILKVYHHHPTPFIFQILKVIAATLPFFLITFWFQEAVSLNTYIIMNLVVFFMFALVITYVSLIYWLDKLVVTNFRVVHIDWKFLTVRAESDVYLKQIEDIQTKEQGFLAHFKFFDYGTLVLDTASSYVALTFLDAPDPEGIRRYLYFLRQQ